MSFPAILLRVLLTITLVLNGVTTAVAATHLEEGRRNHVMSVEVTVAPAASGSTPCHQPDQTPGPVMHDRDATDKAVAGESAHPTPDCCDTGTCECACIHAAQLDFSGSSLRPFAEDDSRGVRRLALGHAAPALPHLIRPPIA